MLSYLYKIKNGAICMLLINLSGCLSLPQHSPSNLFTYMPNNHPVVAIERFGYLTKYDGCLQYRYKGRIATPIFPYAMTVWNEKSGTITVRGNTINLDEFFSFGDGDMSINDTFMTEADERCLLPDTISIGSVTAQKKAIATHPSYRYIDFKRPRIASKERSDLFTYQRTTDQEATTNLVTQTGSIQTIGKDDCLYFLNDYEVATPVFPHGTIWNKDNQTITVFDSIIDIGVGSEVSLQMTGAIPANIQDFATVGDSDCLEELVIPINPTIKQIKKRDSKVVLDRTIELVTPLTPPYFQ